MLGTFILAFGWFGFNAGSSLAGTDGRIGIVAVNTMIAGMAATISGVLYMWIVYGKPDPSMMCNSMLAGLVAITAPCAFVTPVGAFLIGAVAGVLVVWSVFFWESSASTIRSAPSASTASTAPGASSPWACSPTAPTAPAGTASATTATSAWPARASPACSTAMPAVHRAAHRRGRRASVWNVIVGGVIFWVIGKVLGANRVPAEVEIAGLDIPEMGVRVIPSS